MKDKFRNRQPIHPQFFVIGPPRTGTTWMHRELASVCDLPAGKETNFFNRQDERGMTWYAAQFAHTPGKPCGEICPTYFYSDLARERIFQLAPRAKIVCCFRDPVERLYSLYKLKRAEAYHNHDFQQALKCDPEMMESARYGTYFAKWRETFRAENVLATFMEDLVQAPIAYLQRLCEFIGIAPPLKVDVTPAYDTSRLAPPRNYRVAHWFNAHRESFLVRIARQAGAKRLLPGQRSFESMDPVITGTLRDLLLPEIALLESLTNRDLSAWKRGLAVAQTQEIAAVTSVSIHDPKQAVHPAQQLGLSGREA